MKSFDIVVETPMGSSQKYDYDPDSKFFKLSKILPSGMVFPYDFGFIPGTKGEDGDPLDIMIISEFHSFPGCLITCRIIGAIKAHQVERNSSEKIRNDRFIAIPIQSVIYEKISTIKDLPANITGDLQQFFINYNQIAGKVFTPLGILNSKAAIKMIMDNQKAKGDNATPNPVSKKRN